MEVQLASGFLPLLLFAWLSTGTASQPEELNTTVECKLKICPKNLVLCVMGHEPTGLEVGNETNASALGQNCTSLSMHTASMWTCQCRVSNTRICSTDTAKGRQETLPRLDFMLCVLLGLALGTLLYMPVIGILLWQCRGNRKGKLTSRQGAEGKQLDTAAPGTGTEDLNYVNLKFEKETKPASSEVIYTEVKPAAQKQGRGDGSAARAGEGVSCKGEGK